MSVCPVFFIVLALSEVVHNYSGFLRTDVAEAPCSSEPD